MSVRGTAARVAVRRLLRSRDRRGAGDAHGAEGQRRRHAVGAHHGLMVRRRRAMEMLLLSLLLRVGLLDELLLLADAGQRPVRPARGREDGGGLEAAQIGTARGVASHPHATAAARRGSGRSCTCTGISGGRCGRPLPVRLLQGQGVLRLAAGHPHAGTGTATGSSAGSAHRAGARGRTAHPAVVGREERDGRSSPLPDPGVPLGGIVAGIGGTIGTCTCACIGWVISGAAAAAIFF